jgi:hypothetical protein
MIEVISFQFVGSGQNGSVNDVMPKPSNNYRSSAIVSTTSPSIDRYILFLSLSHPFLHFSFAFSSFSVINITPTFR